MLPGTVPLMIGAAYSIVVFACMFALPTPGAFLPKVEEVQTANDNEKSVTLFDKSNDQIIYEFNEAKLAPLSSFAIH